MDTATNPWTSAHDLLPAEQANTVLFNDARDRWTPLGKPIEPEDWATEGFHAAMGGKGVGDLLETNDSTPLLCWTDPDVPAMSLLEALVHPPNHRAKTCDRCHERLRGLPVYRLWVPGGQSAVEFQFCPTCHAVLNEVYRTADDARLLVWR